jgi:hypothetical protein
MTEEHIKPREIARRKEFRLNDQEEEHVRQCEECQRVLEHLAKQITEADKL